MTDYPPADEHDFQVVDNRGGNCEYGDEGFESDELSVSSSSSRDGDMIGEGSEVEIDGDSGEEGSRFTLDFALGDAKSAESELHRVHPGELGARTSSESGNTDHSSKVSASDEAPLGTNPGEKSRMDNENLREPPPGGDNENTVHTVDDGRRSPELAGQGEEDRVGTADWGLSAAYEVDVGDGARESPSDRCPSRGRSKGEAARGGGAGCFPPSRRQKSNGQPQSRGGRLDVGSAHKRRWRRQERIIQQLVHDNGVLQRKVASFQKKKNPLTGPEGSPCASPCFSAVFSASPPPLPREGNTASPSPRVTRSWAHQIPPVRRSHSIDREFSYRSLVRQLDADRRVARMLRGANDALGERVAELESGTVLKTALAKLVERDEDVSALRGELAVMNRLARAQDRKFEGSEGYAMARRLWAVEEDLRVARLTIASLEAEARRLQPPRRTSDKGQAPDPSVRRPAANPRRQAMPLKSSLERGTQVWASRGGESKGCSARSRKVRRSKSKGNEGKRNTRLAGGGRGRKDDAVEPAVAVAEAAEKEKLEMKEEKLQRALANMRSKAKGELRAAQTEIQILKEDKVALSQALESKSKEVRAQLLQVHRLKRELQDLSAGTTKLEEASFVVTSATVPSRPRGAAPAATGRGGMTTTGSNVAVHGRWAKPTAGVSAALGAGDGDSLGSPVTVERRNPRPGTIRGRSTARPPVQYAPMGRSGHGKGGGTPGGTEKEKACASTKSYKATGRTVKIEGDGAVNPTIAALNVDKKGASASDAGASLEGAGEGAARSEARASRPREIGLENLLPCPLSGILDMPEPLRKQSFFCGDGNVRTSSPKNGGGADGGANGEPQVGVRVLKCAVDSDGFVRHAESCVLRDASPRRASTSERFAFKTSSGENVSDELGHIQVSRGDLPVRKWASDEESERDPVGIDRTEDLLVGGRHSPRKPSASLSARGKFTPTIESLKRSTHRAIEPVMEAME